MQVVKLCGQTREAPRVGRFSNSVKNHSLMEYEGPDGELGASLRYLSQRYSMPYPELKGLLTDIGREASEMFHSEATAFFDAFATV